MGLKIIFALAILLSIRLADAAIPNVMRHGRPVLRSVSVAEHTIKDQNGTDLPSLKTVYHFDQLRDHDNVHLGTFKQRYWMNWEFYKAGGPIILTTPGEANAEGFEGYLTNATINGVIAQQHHGATVLIEHRFFGYSNPYDNLTSESLELLTVQQAIDDLVYFAQHVNLPMPGGDNVKPGTTPWILIGGSYSGALTSWTMVNRPGVFHAGYASSAVVEAITNYYRYFTPIREHMPKNCSADVQAVFAHLDKIHAENDTTAIQNLKEAFGLGGLSHIDDFASALQLNLAEWQLLETFTTKYGHIFFTFCDALEVKDGVSASHTGWGLEHAIHSWGSFWKKTYLNHLCDGIDVETCLGTYDASSIFYTNVSVNNDYRSWTWMTCNQLGYYQGGPPEGQPAIVSRIVQPEYRERQCVNMFPEKFSSPRPPHARSVNKKYAGWNVNVDRLFFSNGLRDPWREATVSAEGLNKANTTTQPIYLGDGFHTSDLLIESGIVDETVRAIQTAALEYMDKWLKEWCSN